LKYWLVRHKTRSYKDYNDRIGREKKAARRIPYFRNIRKGHKVIYYTVDTQEVIGLFEIESNNWFEFKWDNDCYCYKIKPIYVPSRPLSFNMQTRKKLGVSLVPRGTVSPLSRADYRKIKTLILGMDDPTNHEGVVALFSKIHQELGYPAIKELRTTFPDAIVEDKDGNEKRIEFEFKSMTFDREGHKPAYCDLVVCWEDNWGSAAKVPVIELKKIIYG
jgi:hypothetical protein